VTDPVILTDDGVRLTARVDGPANAPVLALFNPLGTNLHMWNAQVAALSNLLRLIRFDSRGHGASDVPPGPYSIERLGHDALCVLDHLQIERPHICGLSLGGMIALWMASSHPERVDRAIFANTAARIGSNQTWTERIAAVEKGGMDAIVSLVARRFLSEPFRQQASETTHVVSEIILQTPALGYIASYAALCDVNLQDLASTIQAPSLIIGSELDESTPVDQAMQLQDLILESKLGVIPRAGYLSNIKQPEAFNGLVRQFLFQQLAERCTG
jgi:3-oxoadipate enol-lactonase